MLILDYSKKKLRDLCTSAQYSTRFSTNLPSVQKILITGPESTGKSALAARLAQFYDCPWVPEYARSFLPKLGRPYEEEDLLSILKGQLLQEYQLADPQRPYLFCDTGPEVIAIWSEVKYGQVHPMIEQAMQGQSYDLRLICYPDLPWEDDPLREAPDATERLALFERYVALHEEQGWQYYIVRGTGNYRLEHAIACLRHL